MSRASLSTLVAGLVVVWLGLEMPALAAAGGLDPSFGTGGKVVSRRISNGADIAFSKGGKILVAGDRNARFAVARFSNSGTLDTTFSGGGVATGLFHGYGQATAVMVQSDGKIVATGFTKVPFTLVRFRRDGTLDPSFGNHGIVQTSLGPSCATSQALDGSLAPGGKIVVIGTCGTEESSPLGSHSVGSAEW